MEADLLPAEGPSWGAGGTNDGSWMPAASLGSETWRRLTRFSEGSWTTFPSPGQGGAGSRRNGLALEEGSSSVTACSWRFWSGGPCACLQAQRLFREFPRQALLSDLCPLDPGAAGRGLEKWGWFFFFFTRLTLILESQHVFLTNVIMTKPILGDAAPFSGCALWVITSPQLLFATLFSFSSYCAGMF